MFAHLADVSIRSVLLAVSAAAVLWISRKRRSAALEHAVWTAVMCGMLALFAFGDALPRLPLRVLTSPAAAPLQSAPLLWKAPFIEETAALPAQMPTNVERSINWSDVAIYAYAAIAFAFLARFITGMFLVRRLLAASKPTGVGFLESEVIAVPLTIGCFRPQILLPLEWRDWDRDKLNAVLAHEGAHVRRRDGLVAALAGINRCIFWFHPVAWMLERRLTLLAELACDESCVVALGDREQYARLLLDMACVVDGAHGRLRQHALTMAAASHLRQRIDSLLQDGRTFSRGLTWTGWAAVALCGIPIVLGAGAVELAAPPSLPPLAMPRWSVPVAPALLAQAKPPTPAPSPAAAARPQPAPVYLMGLGSVAAVTVTIKSRVDGQLMSVNFKEGDLVQAGQILASIDPRAYQIQVTQVQGQLDQDAAQLASARQAQAAMPNSQTAAIAQLEAKIRADQAVVDNARLQLSYTQIAAPITGMAGLRLVDPGNIVRAADTTGIVIINQLQPIAVLFHLPEDNLPQVRARLGEGPSPLVEAWSRDNTVKIATGRLTAVDNLIDTTTGNALFKAVFDNKDGALFPNQFVNVRLLIGGQ